MIDFEDRFIANLHSNLVDYILQFSAKEFEDALDEQIAKDSIAVKELEETKSIADYALCKEIHRNTLIKEISVTHNWERAIVREKNGFAYAEFMCLSCGIRASNFENIKCAFGIEKVIDNLPTYTTHNEYLRLPCEAINSLSKNKDDKLCIICGISESAKHSNCIFV